MVEVEIIAVGGYNEVGRNMTAVRVGKEIVIFDIGLYLDPITGNNSVDMENMHSLDLIQMGAIPDDTVMNSVEGTVKAIVCTHGHFDHVGGVKQLAEETGCKVYISPVELLIPHRFTGGPIYYIKAAFKGKLGTFMAGFFAVAIILALGFMGNMVQSNSIGDAFFTAFGVPKIAVGIVVAAVSAFIFLGGVKRIAAITEKLVPIMAIFYICGALIAIGMNAENILPAFQSIFVGAFSPEAVMGGAIGISIKEAVRFGVARGLFSNEAGMGSTPHAHAMAKVAKPQDQGAVAMVGVFIDTFIVLTMTALVILTSGMLGTTGADGQMLTATALAQAAFNNSFGAFGSIFVAICLLFFAFSTIIGWYFFGESNVKALFGGSKKATVIYGIIALVFIVVGSFQKVGLVWDMSDMFNGLMVIPNLLAVLALSGLVAKFAKDDNFRG